MEASTFHGREPNENRWNIDKGKPDSFSSRLTIGLGSMLSGQFSIGRINNREALEPSLDTLRTTASIHQLRLKIQGQMDTLQLEGRGGSALYANFA